MLKREKQKVLPEKLVGLGPSKKGKKDEELDGNNKVLLQQIHRDRKLIEREILTKKKIEGNL